METETALGLTVNDILLDFVILCAQEVDRLRDLSSGGPIEKVNKAFGELAQTAEISYRRTLANVDRIMGKEEEARFDRLLESYRLAREGGGAK